VPIDIDDLPHLRDEQRRHQSLIGPDALTLPKKLAQRGALVTPAHERLERMLVGITCAEALDTQQGGKKQRLKMSLQRSLTVWPQSQVIAHMPRLLGLYRLRELRHNWLKGLLLLKPLGKHMHADP